MWSGLINLSIILNEWSLLPLSPIDFLFLIHRNIIFKNCKCLLCLVQNNKKFNLLVIQHFLFTYVGQYTIINVEITIQDLTLHMVNIITIIYTL